MPWLNISIADIAIQDFRTIYIPFQQKLICFTNKMKLIYCSAWLDLFDFFRYLSFQAQPIFPVCILNPFPNKPWFLRICSTSLLKALREKEKLLVTSNFSFSHSVFYPFGEFSASFIQFEIVVCKLFQFERV